MGKITLGANDTLAGVLVLRKKLILRLLLPALGTDRSVLPSPSTSANATPAGLAAELESRRIMKLFAFKPPAPGNVGRNDLFE